MSRSVVARGTERCERCRCAPRWCICAGLRPVDSRVAIDILLHRREQWRPTSTGQLIQRVMPGARTHVYSHDLPLQRDSLTRPGRQLWILHPQGEPLRPGADPAATQVLLLDGNWREASRMRKAVEGWGRLVSLPGGGGGRYRLRQSPAEGLYSTVEALLVLLDQIGETGAAAGLRLQFELHVYAGLRTRGAIEEAAAFLEESPIRTAFPDLLRDLQTRRPNLAGILGRDRA